MKLEMNVGSLQRALKAMAPAFEFAGPNERAFPEVIVTAERDSVTMRAQGEDLAVRHTLSPGDEVKVSATGVVRVGAQDLKRLIRGHPRGTIVAIEKEEALSREFYCVVLSVTDPRGKSFAARWETIPGETIPAEDKAADYPAGEDWSFATTAGSLAAPTGFVLSAIKHTPRTFASDHLLVVHPHGDEVLLFATDMSQAAWMGARIPPPPKRLLIPGAQLWAVVRSLDPRADVRVRTNLAKRRLVLESGRSAYALPLADESAERRYPAPDGLLSSRWMRVAEVDRTHLLAAAATARSACGVGHLMLTVTGGSMEMITDPTYDLHWEAEISCRRQRGDSSVEDVKVSTSFLEGAAKALRGRVLRVSATQNMCRLLIDSEASPGAGWCGLIHNGPELPSLGADKARAAGAAEAADASGGQDA